MLLAVSLLAGWVGFDLILVGYSRGQSLNSGFPGGELHFSDLVMGKWNPVDGSLNKAGNEAASGSPYGPPGSPGNPYNPYQPPTTTMPAIA